jgi:hypothetical protein
MDKQARRARIEKRLAMEEALDQLDDLPLPERFRTLMAWAEQHPPPADQAWLYQPWQRALEGLMEEPPDPPAP